MSFRNRNFTRINKDRTPHTVAISNKLTVPKVTSLPGVQPAGSIIYNTTDSTLYASDGNVWLSTLGNNSRWSTITIDYPGSMLVSPPPNPVQVSDGGTFYPDYTIMSTAVSSQSSDPSLLVTAIDGGVQLPPGVWNIRSEFVVSWDPSGAMVSTVSINPVYDIVGLGTSFGSSVDGVFSNTPLTISANLTYDNSSTQDIRIGLHVSSGTGFPVDVTTRALFTATLLN